MEQCLVSSLDVQKLECGVLALGNSRVQPRAVEPRLATGKMEWWGRSKIGVCNRSRACCEGEQESRARAIRAVAQMDGALVARVTARALLEQDGP